MKNTFDDLKNEIKSRARWYYDIPDKYRYIMITNQIIDQLTPEDILKILPSINHCTDTERSRDIVIRRFGLNGQPPQTYTAIARIYGCCHGRIGQIAHRMYSKIARRYMEQAELQVHSKYRKDALLAIVERIQRTQVERYLTTGNMRLPKPKISIDPKWVPYMDFTLRSLSEGI